MEKDKALIHNKAHFDHDVEKGASSTIPCLDLDADTVRRFARGELASVPKSLVQRGNFPGIDLANVEGKDVLLMGAGGGQQSAIFGLLGARVTVLELSQGQLDGDLTAAAHYGYEIAAIQGDMQDPHHLDNESFDIVYTVSTMYVPDIRKLFAECGRVTRPGGLLTAGVMQPGRQCRYLAGLIAEDPYRPDAGNAIEYVHYMDDIFNGLIDAGLHVKRVFDMSRNREHDGPVGSLDPTYVDSHLYFIIAAEKPRVRS